MTQLEINAATLDETKAAALQIVTQLKFPMCVYLRGEMGAGKTTLCKSLINAFGYVGEVTSPTYNLIHEYPVTHGVIYHMDLYRLEDVDELEYLALDDLWSENSIFLIEWAERAETFLQAADAEISIAKSSDQSSDNRQIYFKHMRS